MNLAYVGIGSNIEPEKNIPVSLQILSRSVKIIAASSLWHTEAIGTTSQPFLNAAIQVECEFSLHDLKEEVLCSVEEQMGRVRTQDKNAPRPIDLDILVFNNEIQDPAIFSQDHLMFPLSELLPGLLVPESMLTLLQIAQEHAMSTKAYEMGKLVF
jgi:2-amino-4-hydroxy-6-hydroxymethyldihydropteridine diphosphokinase